jgi:hypothetical protein
MIRAVVDAKAAYITYLYGDRTVKSAWSHPDVPLLIFGTASQTNPQVTFHGGPIATGLPVQLLYWGSWWTTAEGSARLALIDDRTQRLLASPYFSELLQYGIQPPHWRGSLIVTQPGPKMAFNSNGDQQAVSDMIDDLIDDDVFPDPDDERIAYVALMPKGFTQTIGANGAHTADYDYEFPFDKDWYWFAWVRSFGDDGVEDPEDALRTMSHELAELFTDPETDGWYSVGASTGEIGDLAAEPDGTKQTAWVNGVHVQAYWSNRHNANVIPIDRDYRAQIVGTVKVDKHTVSQGTFRPDESDRKLCHLIPACCLTDRDYSYTTSEKDETATLRVETQRYRQPKVAWTVEGQAITANGPITVNVECGSFTGRKETFAQAAVTLQCQLSGNDLILKSVGTKKNFDLAVGCSVTDGSITGTMTTNVIATPQLSVGFAGADVSVDPEYMKQRVACEKAAVKMFRDLGKTTPPRWKPGPPGPVEINAAVLANLPVYARRQQYERARRVVAISQLAAEAFDAERARLLSEVLMRDVPALQHALLKQRALSGKKAT